VTPTTLRIGASVGGEQMQGFIQRMTWFNSRVPNASLGV
jgi:hypothetical protein